jgi:hypothetical protein
LWRASGVFTGQASAPIQQAIYDLLPIARVCLLETIHSIPQINQPPLRGKIEDAQCSGSLKPLAQRTVRHDRESGAPDRRSLSLPSHSAKRWFIHPRLNGRWRRCVAHLFSNLGRDRYTLEKVREKIYLSDLHQVNVLSTLAPTNRACVGYNQEHQRPRRRNPARSRSKSASV